LWKSGVRIQRLNFHVAPKFRVNHGTLAVPEMFPARRPSTRLVRVTKPVRNEEAQVTEPQLE
jgi:hypothetical protein